MLIWCSQLIQTWLEKSSIFRRVLDCSLESFGPIGRTGPESGCDEGFMAKRDVLFVFCHTLHSTALIENSRLWNLFTFDLQLNAIKFNFLYVWHPKMTRWDVKKIIFHYLCGICRELIGHWFSMKTKFSHYLFQTFYASLIWYQNTR